MGVPGRTWVCAKTLIELRELYRETWSRDWPEDNAYLSTLWQQTCEVIHRLQRKKRYEFCVLIMRENHEFETTH